MKSRLFDKRIPTILGIGLIIAGVMLTTLVAKNQTVFQSKASNSEEPQNVKITNLSDNSFTVTYQTDAATTGSINYGRDKELGNTELDDLDKEKGGFSQKNIHVITVKKLSPETKYNFIIISGQNTFLNNGIPFQVSTGPSIPPSSNSNSEIKGKVILPNGNAPGEALVYLSTDNSTLLSSTLAKDGGFVFSLKSLRTNDLSSYIKIDKDAVLKLSALDNSLKSTVLVSGQTNSIPTITLSNDYDFTHTSTPVASKSAESLGFPSIKIKSTDLKPKILSPQKDQSFTDQKPQFRGTSLPNGKVKIIIHSEESIEGQVTADNNGNWTYRAPTTLSPGAHTITIQTKDKSGILTTIMQSFTVFASGTQVSESATPSAIPTQKITPTSIPTSTPVPSPTIIVLTPTSIPVPTINVPRPTLMPTGNSSATILTIGGVVATITGIALLLIF